MAEKPEPRKRGRPNKPLKGVPLRFTMPREEYDYLKALGDRGHFGTSVTEVAIHILVREARAMSAAGHQRTIFDVLEHRK
jgi:hypothetical protein